MIEQEGLLAGRLQRLRKQREDGLSDLVSYEADESGLTPDPSAGPVVVHWRIMDEYRYK